MAVVVVDEVLPGLSVAAEAVAVSTSTSLSIENDHLRSRAGNLLEPLTLNSCMVVSRTIASMVERSPTDERGRRVGRFHGGISASSLKQLRRCQGVVVSLFVGVTMTSIYDDSRAPGGLVDNQQNTPIAGSRRAATNAIAHPFWPSFSTFEQHIDRYAYPYTAFLLNFRNSRHTGNSSGLSTSHQQTLLASED